MKKFFMRVNQPQIFLLFEIFASLQIYFFSVFFEDTNWILSRNKIYFVLTSVFSSLVHIEFRKKIRIKSNIGIREWNIPDRVPKYNSYNL